ncbi:MAG: CDGSH iron-sulfur domain-containing protein [Erysipelotrichaceae bacterium]
MKKREPGIVFTQYTPYVSYEVEEVLVEGKVVPIPRVSAICRCGQTQNGPYCDGTHLKVGFVGKKEANRCSFPKRSYASEEIIVYYNPALCAHVKKCVEGLPSVFNFAAKPWIQPQNGEMEQIVETIKRCPSGALTYQLPNEEEVSAWKEAVGFEIIPNGPLCVSGVDLIDDQDSVQELMHTDHYTLCRCGKSRNRPFCDGAHNLYPFEPKGKQE